MITEATIINGLRSGDEKAYKCLYDYHYSVLCGVAYHFVHDYDAAQMIVSDVIFAIWKNRNDFEINQSLRKYLLRSVRNGCLNYLNRQAKQINIDMVKEQLSDMKDDGTDAYPLSKLIEEELDVKIAACLEKLPPLTREIFMLSRFEEYKYDEIATKLNISADVVKYHIKSALNKLRKGLKDYLMILLFFLLSLNA